MLRRNKFITIILLIEILLIFVTAHFFRSLFEYENRLEAWMSNYAVSYAHDLAPRKLLKLQDEDPFPMFEDWTIVGISDAAIATDRTTLHGIEIHHIGYEYGDVLPVTMEKGRFLWKEDIKNSNTNIVLDSSLAFELFGHMDCIGYSVYIEGLQFYVVGISRDDSSLGRKAYYRAYIPLMNEAITMSIPHIGIIGHIRYGSGDIASRQLENHIRQLGFGSNVSVLNIDGESKKASQKIRLNLFISVSIITLLLWRKYIAYVQKKIIKFLQAIKEYYVLELIKTYKKEILSVCVSGIVAVLLTGFCYRILSFQLYIPPSYIPDDLVDYLEYKDIIIKNLILINKGYVYTPSSFLEIQHISRMLNVILSLIWLCGILLLKRLYSTIQVNSSKVCIM